MKGHVNRVRNQRGREWDRLRLRELERANKNAPMVVIFIDGTGTQRVEIRQTLRKRGRPEKKRGELRE